MMTGLRWLRVPTVAAIMALAGPGLSEGVGGTVSAATLGMAAPTVQAGPVTETESGAVPTIPCGPNPGECTTEWSYVQPGVHYIDTSQYNGDFRVNVSLPGGAEACALGFGVSGGWSVIVKVFDATKVFDWAGAAFACAANVGLYIGASTYWN